MKDTRLKGVAFGISVVVDIMFFDRIDYLMFKMSYHDIHYWSNVWDN